jgi:hypothetical protein
MKAIATYRSPGLTTRRAASRTRSMQTTPSTFSYQSSGDIREYLSTVIQL